MYFKNDHATGNRVDFFACCRPKHPSDTDGNSNCNSDLGALPTGRFCFIFGDLLIEPCLLCGVGFCGMVCVLEGWWARAGFACFANLPSFPSFFLAPRGLGGDAATAER